MKNIGIFIFVFFLFAPLTSFATSGACSYHNGVNCSAGATYDGKVQCNDGWINSSVYFSDTDECKQKSSCVSLYPTQGECDVGYATQQAQENANQINDTNRMQQLMSGSSIQTPLVDWTQDPLYLSCKNAQALHDTEMNIYNICVNNELNTLKKTAEQTNTETLRKFSEACAKGEAGSVWDDSLPLDIYGTKCTSPSVQKEKDCEAKDINSFYSSKSDSCVCWLGYALNEKSMCEKEKEATASTDSSSKDFFEFKPVTTTPSKIFHTTTLTPSTGKKESASEIFLKEVNSNQDMSLAIPVNTEPVKKLHWYQRLFNWLFN